MECKSAAGPGVEPATSGLPVFHATVAPPSHIKKTVPRKQIVSKIKILEINILSYRYDTNMVKFYQILYKRPAGVYAVFDITYLLFTVFFE